MSAKKGLGRGLGALIAERATSDQNAGILEVDILRIEPNRQQPRKYFDEAALAELAQSIRDFGVIQPLILKEEDGFYTIIAGERRWRAARMAKLSTVPAIVKDYTETEALQIALIENLQRQDLNPIEEAVCYKKLIDDYFFTQEDIAAKIGKSRNVISYAVSLLNLDAQVQEMIILGRLTAGHGRALLAVKDRDKQFACAEQVTEHDLSVRETEQLIKRALAQNERTSRPAAEKSKAFAGFENDLAHILGTKVSIRDGKKKGVIEIEYYSPEELDRLLCLFKQI